MFSLTLSTSLRLKSLQQKRLARGQDIKMLKEFISLFALMTQLVFEIFQILFYVDIFSIKSIEAEIFWKMLFFLYLMIYVLKTENIPEIKVCSIKFFSYLPK